MRKRSSSKRHNVSVCVNAGDAGETCRTCGLQNERSLRKRYHPSLRYRTCERVTFASVWISGWYTYLFHTCTHSQFRDAQFVISVCVYVSRFEVKHASTASYNARKPLQQSVVSHCRLLQMWEVFDGLLVRRKSHLKIKHKEEKKKARDGKRSAMYRVKLPSQDKNNSCIMAQLLVFFATSKCSPRVIKWFKQTSQPAHVNELYDRKLALKTNVKK